jgi:2-alkyl-3-oxoalkanoate reductase
VRVAVTGASGFIGSHVAHALVENGDEVVGFGRRPRELCRLLDDAVEYRQWDFVLQPLPDMARFDAVVHSGAAVEDWGNAGEIHRANVAGTSNVISAFRGARFIFISTASVYPPFVDNAFIAETAPLPGRYLNAYSASKREAEQVVREASGDWLILRPHAVYGPGDTTLLPRIMAAYRAGVIPVPGDGRNHISLTHVSTLSSIVIRCLDPTVPGGIYNVCDAGTPTVDEAIYALFGAEGKSVRIVHIPRLIALGLGAALELIWGLFKLPHRPPITRYAVAQLAYEYTLDRTKLTRINVGDGTYWASGIGETMMAGR